MYIYGTHNKLLHTNIALR